MASVPGLDLTTSLRGDFDTCCPVQVKCSINAQSVLRPAFHFSLTWLNFANLLGPSPTQGGGGVEGASRLWSGQPYSGWYSFIHSFLSSIFWMVCLRWCYKGDKQQFSVYSPKCEHMQLPA